MVSIKELRERVSSVKNTQKITSAMRLVAAAKVRRAQEACTRSRPFSETLERILGGLLKRLSTEALDIPLLTARPAKTVGLVVITGDRGLCGSYNSAAIKKTESRIAELKSQGVAVELILVGNKGGTYFGRRDTPVRKSVPCGQAPTAEQAWMSANWPGYLNGVSLGGSLVIEDWMFYHAAGPFSNEHLHLPKDKQYDHHAWNQDLLKGDLQTAYDTVDCHITKFYSDHELDVLADHGINAARVVVGTARPTVEAVAREPARRWSKHTAEWTSRIRCPG